MSVGLMDRLRRLAAGDSLHGLRGEAFEQAARELPTEAKRRLRIETLARLEQLRREGDEARAADLAAELARAAEQADKGRPVTVDAGPAMKCERAEAVARRVSGLAGELGLRSSDGAPVSARYCLEALADRAAVLAELLEAAYRRDGEPAALRELRRELSRAKASEWEARRSHEESQRRYNALRDPEAEAGVMAAAAASDEAARKVGAIKAELAREWAIVI